MVTRCVERFHFIGELQPEPKNSMHDVPVFAFKFFLSLKERKHATLLSCSRLTGFFSVASVPDVRQAMMRCLSEKILAARPNSPWCAGVALRSATSRRPSDRSSALCTLRRLFMLSVFRGHTRKQGCVFPSEPKNFKDYITSWESTRREFP